MKCESTPQKQPNIIFDRSAISEKSDLTVPEVKPFSVPEAKPRPSSETFINPMLRSLVSRQKKARQPGTHVSDQQRKMEVLARL